MKKYFLFLCFIFSLAAFSQSYLTKVRPKLSVVSSERMNVVYRGINNSISIAVPNCKSFKATAPGLKKITPGHYQLSPGSGNVVDIQIVIIQKDNSIVIEKQSFRILNISSPIAKINGNNCFNCIVEVQRKNIKNAIISIEIEDFLFDMDFKVASFIVTLPNENPILNEGNKISSYIPIRVYKI